MREFTTVFEISTNAAAMNTDDIVRLVLGIAALTGGIAILLIMRWHKSKFSIQKAFPALFLIVWGVFWLAMHISGLVWTESEARRMLAAYRSEQCPVAEGLVHVTHVQPESGHDAGDEIAVGGIGFKVNYYLVTPGYHNTISHGGILREGVYARLTHCDGTILKVEIAPKP